MVSIHRVQNLEVSGRRGPRLTGGSWHGESCSHNLLTFHDPERLNAMTEAMGQAITRAVAELSGDDSVRAVVLTGSGRAFSAGGDLDMIGRMAEAGRADPGGPTREENRAFEWKDFDSLVLVTGRRSNDGLFRELKARKDD